MTEKVDLRPLMRHWPAGITVVTSIDPEYNDPCGMTVSTFTSLSLEPPLVSVFLKKEVQTTQAILKSKVFGVSILREGQEDISNRFAGFDPNYQEHPIRFDGLTVETAVTGAPLLADSVGWFDCRLWAVYDGNTHYIVIGEVIETSDVDAITTKPLLYYNQDYRRLADG
ncbi:MAG: flavin reductase family protein [Chloroflexi bacterium]|nr:flavin reductase family protein [Chloroflexota bacterium]